MRCRGLGAVCYLALGLLALLITTPGWAADPVAEYDAIKRASLRGIESLEVVVPPARVVAQCRPIAPEDLQSQVEDRLERAGIRIGPGTASYLIVKVASIEPVKDLLCGFTVLVELQQVVLLVRDTRIMTFGMTWQHAGLGVAAPARFPESLQRMLAELVDEFIAAYRDQNPPR